MSEIQGLTELDSFLGVQEDNLDGFELSLIEQNEGFEIIEGVLCKKEEILGN